MSFSLQSRRRYGCSFIFVLERGGRNIDLSADTKYKTNHGLHCTYISIVYWSALSIDVNRKRKEYSNVECTILMQRTLIQTMMRKEKK